MPSLNVKLMLQSSAPWAVNGILCLIIAPNIECSVIKTLYSTFRQKYFALNPEDVPTLKDGPMPSNGITLQHLNPAEDVTII